MGLAGPKKRIKISHDPNNLTWAQSTDSYGQKLLSSQGWKPGQGLGAHGSTNFNSPVAAIKVAYKDDNLGLGANLKSANREQSRTGLDAFQGLLGRLNSKDEAEIKRLEQRSEDRKLAMWTQGKWGGVMFVPGGLLVQGDKFKKANDKKIHLEVAGEGPVETPNQKAARKVTKALRKAERRERKEAKLRKSAEGQARSSALKSGTGVMPDSPSDIFENKSRGRDSTSVPHIVEEDIEKTTRTNQDRKKRKTSRKERNGVPDTTSDAVKEPDEENVLGGPVQSPSPPSEGQETPIAAQMVHSRPKNGRHLIRGRDIQAKRMAFADSKLLDEIFMRKS